MVDYNDIMRYMQNLSKGSPKTAANRAANFMRDLHSGAMTGGNNVVNAANSMKPTNFILSNEVLGLNYPDFVKNTTTGKMVPKSSLKLPSTNVRQQVTTTKGGVPARIPQQAIPKGNVIPTVNWTYGTGNTGPILDPTHLLETSGKPIRDFGFEQGVNPQYFGQNGTYQYGKNVNAGAYNKLNGKTAQAVTRANALRTAKSVLKYAPLTGDVYDIGSGSSKVYRGLQDGNWGQVALGLGQFGVGAFGLATLGGGSVIKGLGKMGIKSAMKNGFKKLSQEETKKLISKGYTRAQIRDIEKAANWEYSLMRGASHNVYRAGNNMINAGKLVHNPIRYAADLGLGAVDTYDAYKYLSSNNDITGDSDAQRKYNELLKGIWGSQPSEVQKQPGKSEGVDVTKGGNAIPNATRVANGSGGMVNGVAGVSGVIPNGNQAVTPELVEALNKLQEQNGSVYNNGNGRDLLYDYMMQQQYMNPYRRDLQNYINNYRVLNDMASAHKLRNAGLAGMEGDMSLYKDMDKYEPLNAEASRLALQKTAGEDLQGVHKGYNQLLGNIALVNKMGLPVDSALADEDFVRLAVTKDINKDRLENRLEVEQAKAVYRMQYAQAQAQLKAALKSGNKRSIRNAQNKVNQYNKILELVETYGVPVDVATSYVNNSFGSNFAPPPVESDGLYNGRTLHR